MTTLREAAQQALEALEDHAKQYPHMQKGYTVDAINALRAALAEPVQAESITDALMNVVDRLGSEYDQVDPRAWQHLLVYAPKTEPVQEPVAWMMVNKTHNLGPSLHWKPQTDWHITWEAVPLYTHPPRRLTDDQIGQIWFAAKIPGLTESDARRLIRVAEEAK